MHACARQIGEEANGVREPKECKKTNEKERRREKDGARDSKNFSTAEESPKSAGIIGEKFYRALSLIRIQSASKGIP